MWLWHFVPRYAHYPAEWAYLQAGRKTPEMSDAQCLHLGEVEGKSVINPESSINPMNAAPTLRTVNCFGNG